MQQAEEVKCVLRAATGLLELDSEISKMSRQPSAEANRQYQWRLQPVACSRQVYTELIVEALLIHYRTQM